MADCKFGLIGTVTYDIISYESGQTFQGLGGVLYQAAFLCGLGQQVYLYTNLGKDLAKDVEALTKDWLTLHREGIKFVPGPGNRVNLHYPEKGERVEILESVVPPLDPEPIIPDLPKLAMLLLIINSGFDIELEDWRRIVRSSTCPIWLDIHSLPLEKKLGLPREYRSLAEWREWTEGVDYLQANRKEVALMLGLSQRLPTEDEITDFSQETFRIGVKALFVTLGKEGAFVLSPETSKKIRSPEIGAIVDTTGCGDVFCAATAAKLARGIPAFEAASFGIHLASKAATISGIGETYLLALSSKKELGA